jgi:hypothetical protein
MVESGMHPLLAVVNYLESWRRHRLEEKLAAVLWSLSTVERVVSEMHFYRLVSWSVLSARVKLMFGSTLYSG